LLRYSILSLRVDTEDTNPMLAIQKKWIGILLVRDRLILLASTF
jgi:hypothetical protein